jgi:hypothetical protein
MRTWCTNSVLDVERRKALSHQRLHSYSPLLQNSWTRSHESRTRIRGKGGKGRQREAKGEIDAGPGIEDVGRKDF